jgi:hypothetical protein
MKNKVDILEERLAALNNILGDIDSNEVNSARNTTTKSFSKIKTVSDAIASLQKEISDNDSITFKEVYKKCNFFSKSSRDAVAFPQFRKAKD